MCRTLAITILTATVLGASGCALPAYSPHAPHDAYSLGAVRSARVTTTGWERAALTTLGPARRPDDLPAGSFYLGAGDGLGQAVFARYVAHLRDNPDIDDSYVLATTRRQP